VRFWVADHQNGQSPLNDTFRVVKLSSRCENRPRPFPAADLIFFLWDAWGASRGNLLFFEGAEGASRTEGDADGPGDVGRATGMGRPHSQAKFSWQI